MRLALALALISAAGAEPACSDERPRSAGLYDGEILVDGVRRTYVLFVPNSYDGRTPMPLVINSPNTGVSALEELRQSGLVESGRGDRYMVVTLNGLNRALNVLQDARASELGADDVRFARALHRSLLARLCIDAARVYATGISRGGRFASRLASEMSDIVSAVGVVSGLRYPQPNNASRPVPVIAFHGTADRVNPYAEGGPGYWQTGVEDAAARWAQFNGCRARAELRVAAAIVKVVHSGCYGNADVVLYRIEGGGHTWPGSTFYAAHQARLGLGPTTLEISASDLMWAFWGRHAPAALPAPRNAWRRRAGGGAAEAEAAAMRAEAAPPPRLRMGSGGWARLWAEYARPPAAPAGGSAAGWPSPGVGAAGAAAGQGNLALGAPRAPVAVCAAAALAGLALLALGVGRRVQPPHARAGAAPTGAPPERAPTEAE